MKTIYLFLLTLSFGILSAHAQSTDRLQGITQTEYNNVIDKVEQIYRPVIEGMGEKLIIYRKWEFNIENAFAERMGYTKEWTVSYYGGLARYKSMTPDAFTIIVCHEFGHHIGGAPLSKWSGRQWASVEGQADYWAGLKCLRQVWENEDNQTVVSQMKVPAQVREQCAKQWSEPNQQNICIRSILAGTVFAQIFNASPVAVSFEKPSKDVAIRTLEEHPSGQCRLDTLAQAALCNEACEEDKGAKPLCWYKN